MPLDDLNKLFPSITLQQIQQLRSFADLLKAYNKKLNLISRIDIEQLWTNHIFPSLLADILLPFLSGVAVLDLGSGGGLPGFPLKIIRPDLKFVLLDSSQKKTAFLRMAAMKLGLSGVEIVNTRISPPQIDNSLLSRFQVVTARAVANFDKLIKWSLPLLETGGYLLAWKGESDLAELPAVVKEKGLEYQVVRVPKSYWPLSPKFEQLCFVKLYAEKSGDVNAL
jgi:16S rRNA (guanine527-N7)-methyltransferase